MTKGSPWDWRKNAQEPLEGGDAGEEGGLPFIKRSSPPEVPAVVGHALSRAVGGGGLQDYYLHLLAGVALDRGHGTLPLP